MNSLCAFIRSCGVFFLLTINGNAPAGRPFGAILERDGDLFVSTGDTKQVYTQLINNTHVQLIALKNGTRDWIRVTGDAEECFDLSIKAQMLQENPALQTHFKSPDAAHYSVFRIKINHLEFYE